MPRSYHKRVYLRTKRILWGPIEVTAAILGLLVILSRPVMDYLLKLWEGLPWWVGMLILAGLLLYAFARATHEEYQELENERDEWKRKYEALEAQHSAAATQERLGLTVIRDEGRDNTFKHGKVFLGEGYAGSAEVTGARLKGKRGTVSDIELHIGSSEESKDRTRYEEQAKQAAKDAVDRFKTLAPDNNTSIDEREQQSNDEESMNR